MNETFAVGVPKHIRKRVVFGGPNECWPCTGHSGNNGYRVVTVAKRTMLAHRYFYELANGPIPEGKHLDHLCRVRNCVNPHHLEAVTPKENVLRGIGLTAQNAKKTHCKHGHEFTPENTYVTPKGFRYCKQCRTDIDYRRYWGKAGRTPDQRRPNGRPRTRPLSNGPEDLCVWKPAGVEA